MCLYTLPVIKTRASLRETKSFIATRNIKVYKRVKHNRFLLRSPYKSFDYEPNKLYAAKLKKEEINLTGRHWQYQISKGLHAYYDFDRAKRKLSSNEIIVLCIIPKGATYWKGECMEIVSDKLFITDQVYTNAWLDSYNDNLRSFNFKPIAGLNKLGFNKYRVNAKLIKYVTRDA